MEQKVSTEVNFAINMGDEHQSEPGNKRSQRTPVKRRKKTNLSLYSTIMALKRQQEATKRGDEPFTDSPQTSSMADTDLHSECIIAGKLLLCTLDRIRVELVQLSVLHDNEQSQNSARREVIEYLIAVFYDTSKKRKKKDRTCKGNNSDVGHVTVKTETTESSHDTIPYTTVASHISTATVDNTTTTTGSSDTVWAGHVTEKSPFSVKHRKRGRCLRKETDRDDESTAPDEPVMKSPRLCYEVNKPRSPGNSDHSSGGALLPEYVDSFTESPENEFLTTDNKTMSYDEDNEDITQAADADNNIDENGDDFDENDVLIEENDAIDENDDVINENDALIDENDNVSDENDDLDENDEEGDDEKNNINDDEIGSHDNVDEVIAKDELKSRKRSYRCDICEFVTGHRSSLHRHVKHVHALAKTKFYSCNICEKKFTTLEAKTSHLLSRTHSNTVPCPVCNQQFTSTTSLRHHRKLKHSDHNNSSDKACSVCNKNFLTDKMLQGHMNSHTKEKTFECERCYKKFAQEPSLIRHKQSCWNSREFVCTVCGRGFSTREGMKDHDQAQHQGALSEESESENEAKVQQRPTVTDMVEEATEAVKTEKDEDFNEIQTPTDSTMTTKSTTNKTPKNSQLTCKFCDKTFTKNFRLQNHILYCHIGVEFPCESCGKIYTTKSNLNLHVKSVHQNTFKYFCDFCGKGFQNAYILRAHVNRHTGNKPFACDICGKKFVQTEDLKSHKNSCGSTQGKFSCNICKKIYKSQRYYREHLKYHTEKQRFNCPVCGEEYAHRSSLKRHLKKPHV